MVWGEGREDGGVTGGRGGWSETDRAAGRNIDLSAAAAGSRLPLFHSGLLLDVDFINCCGGPRVARVARMGRKGACGTLRAR